MGDRGTGRGRKAPATRPKQPPKGRGRPATEGTARGGTIAASKKEPQKTPIKKSGLDKGDDKPIQPKTPGRRTKAQTDEEKDVKKKVTAVIKPGAMHCKIKQEVAPISADPRTKLASPGRAKRLKDVVENITLRMNDISEAAEKVNVIVETIIINVSRKDELFRGMKKLSTGSYYEKVKISKPNEFDIMLKITLPDWQRVDLTEFGSSGAFYTMTFKRKPSKNAEFLDKYVDNGNVSAKKILARFRELVKDTVSGMPVSLQRRSPSSPAITLMIENGRSTIAVDLVLALEIRQARPQKTRGGMNIESWLGTKVKKDLNDLPFYMVPKQCKEEASTTKDTWRISFSHIEKEILINHGSAKTCCESEGKKCCRKNCLKLMKHLLERLKSKEKGLSQFCSYFAKTALFHQCVAYPSDDQWEDLEECFKRYIAFFQTCLRNSHLPNFFIPSHNLFSEKNISCNLLYKALEDQKMNGFPLF